MYVRIEKCVEFRDATGRLFASYHFDDPYKSFFRGLCTPRGQDVVAVPLPDHPHHKGLQYGLCAEDVNFWEEDNDPANRRIGRQHNQKLDLLTGAGAVGFRQELVWQDETCVSFYETRKISVEQRTPSAYAWTWQTVLTAARDLRLVVSAWPQNGGYCGLGVRLASDLFLKKSTVMLVPDGSRVSGSIPESISVRGTDAEVKFEQDTQLQKDVLYLQGCNKSSEDDFAFISLGPTNRDPRVLKKGECLKGAYVITVVDR